MPGGVQSTGSIEQTAFNAKASLFMANILSGGLENVLAQYLESGSVDPMQAAVAAVVAGAAAPGDVGSSWDSALRGFLTSGYGTTAVEAMKLIDNSENGCR